MQNTKQQPGAEFIRRLRQAGVEADDLRLAEMVWLARLMPPPTEQPPPGPERAVAQSVPAPEPAPPLVAPIRGPIEMITRSYRDEPVNAVFVNTAAEVDGGIRVSRRRVTGVPPLPDAEALARALRPFHRRWPRGAPGPLDETATVERAAESDLILPVRQPSREKWFDAVVVFEDRPAMVVWRETVREFRRMLDRHGAFRDAQLWRLVFTTDARSKNPGTDNTKLEKARPPRLLSLSDMEREPDAICDPAGRRVVFLFSDGVSPVWRDGRMQQAVERWGRRMPVVLVQLLNEEQWFRTAHGDPQLRVSAPQPGIPNRNLEVERTSVRSPGEQTEVRSTVALPIVMPYPRSLARWAAMLMKGGVDAPALVLTGPAASSPDQPFTNAASNASLEINVAQRLQSLTGAARKLACVLSAVPLQVPVMRLVQRATLPDSRIEHLAEIMLSGLVKRSRADQDVSALAEDEIDFDFISLLCPDDVRDQLQRELRFGELDHVLQCVSDYVSDRLGRRFDLRALIADADGPITVPTEAFPFARIAARALALHGIRPKTGRREVIEGRATGQVALAPFSFTTVTFNERGRQTVHREPTARQFIEELADGVAMEMVEIPGGKFLMGSPDDEAERYDDEGPQHPVTVPPFYIGKFTITQQQWKVVAGWEKVERDLKPDPSKFKGDDRPVESIDWFDAKEFCARLAYKTGHAYRLPTEAEWEYACRAGTTTPFAFGQNITPEIVNYNGEYPYAKAKKGKNRGETVPVGSLGMANAFGLFDMHGNVWEWCEDVWHPNYEGVPTDGSAWLSGEDSSRRLLRGGSCIARGRACRSACRSGYDARYIFHNVGLRVVVSARAS